jgi:hypothetical protein
MMAAVNFSVTARFYQTTDGAASQKIILAAART